MAFPKFHGITIAQNGFIENLRVERLEADPVPSVAGRIWFNTAERAFKFSALDTEGAVIVRTFPSKEELTAALQDAVNRIAALEGSTVKKDGSVAFTADVNFGGNKASNVAEPTASTDAATKGYVDQATAGVQAQVDALGNAFNYVGLLPGQTGVTGTGTEADPYVLDGMQPGFTDAGDYYKVAQTGWFKLGSDAAVYAAVNDGLVFNGAGSLDRINNQQSSVAGTTDEVVVTGSVETGFTVALAAAHKQALADAGQAAAGAQAELDATQAGAGLASDGSHVARTGTNYLDSATSLAGEVGLLDAALKAADNRAKAVEGNLESLATTAKTDLVSAINEVAEKAGEGTNALKDAINGQRFTYTSAAPALQHVVQHDLNSGLVSVDVWTKDDLGVYRNDIVAVSLTNANTVTIDLTEARDVKVVVQALDDLA